MENSGSLISRWFNVLYIIQALDSDSFSLHFGKINIDDPMIRSTDDPTILFPAVYLWMDEFEKPTENGCVFFLVSKGIFCRSTFQHEGVITFGQYVILEKYYPFDSADPQVGRCCLLVDLAEKGIPVILDYLGE